MELVTQLQNITKETSGCFFKMSIQAKSDYWTVYIFRSKVQFRGSFEKVLQQTINEILQYRTPKPKDAPRNITQAFQYLKEPSATQTLEEFLPKKLNNSYESKLEFSISKGFKNVAEAYYELGAITFGNQFKEYQSKI